MDIKVLVAAHKKYEMPEDKDTYLPVFVGKALHPEIVTNFQGDDEGENISDKNPNYNELTAMYWAWKNLKADAVGLVHYRRYLSYSKKKSLNSILSHSDIENLLGQVDIILPKKRSYYVETNYSHYVHAHHREPIDETRNILVERYPEYVSFFDNVMKKRAAHMFNMFIMKKGIFDEYCEWVFSILFELESRIDISEYNQYESRVFGFVSERLLDVWISKKGYSFEEVNFVFMEKQNWLKKGGAFLMRKIKPNY